MSYKDKEKYNKYMRKWKRLHKNKIKEYNHNYYIKHKDKYIKPVKNKEKKIKTYLTSEEYLQLKNIRRWKNAHKKNGDQGKNKS